jgi:hypothetical protein
MNRKQTLCLDFDGVLHLYASGWKGARHIPDDPVPGAMNFLIDAVKQFDVCIYSSRSSNLLGRWAMRRWLMQHMTVHMLDTGAGDTGNYFTFQDELDDAKARAEEVIDQIRFPWFKPPAHVTIDDRALRFTGAWPSLDVLKRFESWN